MRAKQASNVDAEMAALGCMMFDSDGADCVFRMLKESDFYDSRHVKIYNAGRALNDRNDPVNLASVSRELNDNSLADYLIDLVDPIPSSADAPYHCGQVAEESKKRKLAQFARRIENAASQSAPADIEALRKQLDEIAQDMPGDPSRSVVDRLRDKQNQEKKREPGELLGYRLGKFEQIGSQIDGIQPGFYVFAGITHVGKTLFLTNIFLDLLKSNPDLHGVYFSLDDNENVIINRLLAILCGGALTINELQRRVANPEELDGAYNELISMAKSGRFNILDFSQVQTVENVESVIRGYIRKEQKLFVVIDGLQNIETGKEYGGLREKNVDLATSIKKIVDVYRIPLLTSVEIRKRKDPDKMPTIDDIMETGKYGYNASHVWIAHPNKDYQNFIDYEKDKYNLTIATVKSKISSAGGPVKMIVNRPYNKLTFADGPGGVGKLYVDNNSGATTW